MANGRETAWTHTAGKAYDLDAGVLNQIFTCSWATLHLLIAVHLQMDG